MSATELTELMVRQAGELQPFAVSLTQDRESAKDLCQETIYRALSNIDKYQLGTNPRSWLCTIMRNIFINDYRRQKRNPQVHVDDDRLVLFQGAGGETILSAISKKEIELAVRSLPGIFHAAFSLYVQGFKYHEIAALLQEPVGTIKSRIHIARKTLKEQIKRN